jgi:hypothetical protein
MELNGAAGPSINGTADGFGVILGDSRSRSVPTHQAKTGNSAETRVCLAD